MAATSIIAKPPQLLRELVAASPTFQTWVGVASEAAALDRVYKGSARPKKVVRPYAIVSYPLGHRVGRGGFGQGELVVIFEAEVPPGTPREPHEEDEVDIDEAAEPFLNTCGDIIEEMAIESENAGRLFVSGDMQLVGTLTRSKESAKVDWWQLAYMVPWGAKPP